MKNEAIAELQVYVYVCVYIHTHTPTTRDISKNEVIKSYHRLESLYFLQLQFNFILRWPYAKGEKKEMFIYLLFQQFLLMGFLF